MRVCGVPCIICVLVYAYVCLRMHVFFCAHSLSHARLTGRDTGLLVVSVCVCERERVCVYMFKEDTGLLVAAARSCGLLLIFAIKVSPSCSSSLTTTKLSAFVCVCVCLCVCMCMCNHSYILTCVHTFMQTYMYIRIRKHVHTHIHTTHTHTHTDHRTNALWLWLLSTADPACAPACPPLAVVLLAPCAALAPCHIAFVCRCVACPFVECTQTHVLPMHIFFSLGSSSVVSCCVIAIHTCRPYQW